MISPGRILRRAGIVLASMLLTGAVFAAPIDVIYIGTWSSTGSGNLAGSGGPSMSPGQRFVIKITYDDNPGSVTNNVDVLNSSFNPSGATMSTINLQGPGNSLDLFVPMEGFDGASPFVYTQNESDHFSFGLNSTVPTLNFADGSDISNTNNIIGLEFEGDFAPGAQQNVVELFNTSADGSTINMVSQVNNLSGGGGIAASDTSVQGTSLVAAVDLDISAGANLAFDAGNLTQTTSSAVNQSNDLGAARSDNEDFIDASWSVTGTEAGTNGNDVAVSIANSGLTNTTDSVTWDVTMTEQFTGLSDAESITVSYNNAGPTAEAGGTIVFDASNLTQGTTGATASDADLAVNAVIGGFESLSYSTDADGNPLANGNITGSSVANNIDQLIAIADSGLTNTTDTATFSVTVTDFAGETSTDTAIISYVNSNPTASASATATATGTDFTLTVADLDEIVNSIIAGFENVMTTLDVDGMDATAFFNTLLMTGSQSSTDAALEAAFGLGVHTLTVTAVDFAGAAGMDILNFEVFGDVDPPEVPEPATLALLLAGLLAMFLVRRRRITARATAD